MSSGTHSMYAFIASSWLMPAAARTPIGGRACVHFSNDNLWREALGNGHAWRAVHGVACMRLLCTVLENVHCTSDEFDRTAGPLRVALSDRSPSSKTGGGSATSMAREQLASWQYGSKCACGCKALHHKAWADAQLRSTAKAQTACARITHALPFQREAPHEVHIRQFQIRRRHKIHHHMSMLQWTTMARFPKQHNSCKVVKTSAAALKSPPLFSVQKSHFFLPFISRMPGLPAGAACSAAQAKGARERK